MKSVIIIPTYNERENISQLVTEIFDTVPTSVYVMVVDDNSPDGTGDIVESLKKMFPRLSLLHRRGKEGLGKAYLDAFGKVLEDKEVDSLIMMDADFSHHPRYLKEILSKKDDYDVVVGSRYVPQGTVEGWELWRRVLSFGGNLYCRIITRISINDCTGGFNLIRTDILRKIDPSSFDASGYAFIFELKYLLFNEGARFVEVPIIFKNRTGGESKISNHIIKEGILAPWKMIMKK
ncbi:MAG: hypothetical protein A2V96_02670 [Candidatus Yonathbacteria bacterium RBG_16_43_6]|uniref:Glycosyltransferase 2-like domain-containing protein n=1 Tax=Candidatus Yonathbacteria bacterium RIFCSPLOWO2_01_FULL_43_27 TaxID=1802726 RepID=A0A1G2SCP2_9BACT|nr:MAG: hypothetical protein A2V96_02670 [Candidatus Yonathbacteria bacterium RBG_16_43_6]OHA82492.1 MAG: hypothetical protein A3B07_02615 [Candidatus Yonathbacteria bacterium RIFCSPLOWO2_01_FULL_43_27]